MCDSVEILSASFRTDTYGLGHREFHIIEELPEEETSPLSSLSRPVTNSENIQTKQRDFPSYAVCNKTRSSLFAKERRSVSRSSHIRHTVPENESGPVNVSRPQTNNIISPYTRCRTNTLKIAQQYDSMCNNNNRVGVAQSDSNLKRGHEYGSPRMSTKPKVVPPLYNDSESNTDDFRLSKKIHNDVFTKNNVDNKALPQEHGESQSGNGTVISDMINKAKKDEVSYVNIGAVNEFISQESTNSAHKTNKKWAKQARTLQQMLDDDSPPFLIKYSHGDLSKYIPAKLVDKPGMVLKVLEVRRQKLLVGKRMLWDRINQQHIVGEQTFEMPANTKGWFEVYPEDGRPVEYFDTIYGITTVKANRFLVRTSTVGYRMMMENGISTWLPCEIKAGETLTAGIVYMDSKKQAVSVNVKNMLKRLLKQGKLGSHRDKDLKYLQCFNAEGYEIMIPLVMSGVFSPIGDPATTNYDAVYDLNDLLLAFPLPVKTQLVHGKNKIKSTVPKGVLKIEGSREEESALVTMNSSSETFEIPLDNDLLFYKESVKHRIIVKEISLALNEQENANAPSEIDRVYGNTTEVKSVLNKVTLPTKIRDSRKSKGAALFEKFSQRKNKKDRDHLKALQEQGVFSSKLSKPETTYDDFYLGFKNAESESCVLPHVEVTSCIDEPTVPQRSEVNIIREKPKKPPKPKILSLSVNNVANEEVTKTMPTRSLPPIPVGQEEALEEPDALCNGDSTETLYEHLPSTPGLSDESESHRKDIKSGADYSSSDDGYLAPSEVKYENEIMFKGFEDYPCYDDVYVKNSIDTEPTHSSSPKKGYQNLVKSNSIDTYNVTTHKGRRYESNVIDENSIYTSTYIGNSHGQRDSICANKRHRPYRRFKRNDYSSTTAIPDNVCCRSLLSANDVVSYSDSFNEQRRRSVSQDRLECVIHDPIYKPSEAGYSGTQSEPSYRNFGGLSDTYIKNGDDSAISMCSRGEYVVSSDYSYTSFSETRDDDWVPPDDINNLSVAEVSKSLRYIGMKDRIVIRFSREQIDGEMLCSLDEKLLVEGFAELNALEVKKVLDFVSGWRPKK